MAQILTPGAEECASLKHLPWAVGVVAMSLPEIQAFVTANLAVVVGGVVALLIVVFLATRPRKTPSEFEQLAAAGPPDTTNIPPTQKALSWEPPEQSYADRRGSSRRDGAPVRVTVSSPSF